MKNQIGLYCGSFNPFHMGHYSILVQAEQIFKKVIVGVGVNPDKEYANEKYAILRKNVVAAQIPDREVWLYVGFLTDFIKDLENKGNDVVLIRGLRNGHDLEYEINQYRFLKDLKKDIKIMFLPCEQKYEHISSSAIRSIEKIDPKFASKYIYNYLAYKEALGAAEK